MTKRDFTSETKKTLKRYCREAQEKICDFTDGFDDFVTTEWYSLIGESHMSDKSAMDTLNYTEKEIEAIFNNVHYVDGLGASGLDIILSNINNISLGLQGFEVSDYLSGNTNSVSSLNNIETSEPVVMYPSEVDGKKREELNEKLKKGEQVTFEEMLDVYSSEIGFDKNCEFVVAPGVTYFCNVNGKISNKDIKEAQKKSCDNNDVKFSMKKGVIYITQGGKTFKVSKDLQEISSSYETNDLDKDPNTVLTRKVELAFHPSQLESVYSNTVDCKKQINSGGSVHGSVKYGVKHRPYFDDKSAENKQLAYSYVPAGCHSLDNNRYEYRKNFNECLEIFNESVRSLGDNVVEFSKIAIPMAAVGAVIYFSGGAATPLFANSAFLVFI